MGGPTPGQSQYGGMSQPSYQGPPQARVGPAGIQGGSGMSQSMGMDRRQMPPPSYRGTSMPPGIKCEAFVFPST